MATDAPVEAEAPVEAPEAAAPAGKSSMMKFGIILIVAMVAEAGAILFLTSGGDSAKTDEQVEEVDETASNSDVVEKEVTIGDFNTVISHGESGGSIHVRFKLSATVSTANSEKFKDAVSDTHESRVREAVIAVCRGSSRSDLNNEELTFFKRKIRDRVNKILRQSYIIEVIISDFQTMEQ